MESEVFLEPEPRATNWAALAEQRRDDTVWRGKPLSEWRGLTRRELGLPDDKIIIAAGHQAGFWHPGILAKFFAGDSVVDAIGRDRALLLHLVVDQDDNDGTGIDVPIRDADGVLHARRIPIVSLPDEAWVLHTPYGSHLERPTGEFPALEPVDAAGRNVGNDATRGVLTPALPSIPDSLRRIETGLRNHRGAGSLALQVSEAVQDEIAASIRRPALLCASQLLDTSFGRSMVDEIARDPAACVRSYNETVGSGEGEVRPLAGRGDTWELPLWRIDASGQRRPVYASELASIEPSSLRPRALLMTAIMRLVVCDLFTHGRGGFEYDRAMETWIGEWLGLPVCPMTMASADLRLPLPEVDVVTARDLQRAISADYRFRHDPESKGGQMSAAKRQWLREIDALPRRSRERRQRFIDYHRWLDQARTEHKAELDASYFHLVQLCRKMESRKVLIRRDWAFPLYPREMLDELNAMIRARFRSQASTINLQSSIQGPPDQPVPGA